MSALRFDTTFPDGAQESLQTDAERVLIGRGAHCEIRLPDADCALEHVAVETHGGSIRVAVCAPTPPTLLDGAPISDVTVDRDAVLCIGAVTIRVSRIDSVAQATPAKASSSSAGLRIVGALLALTLVAMLMSRAARQRDVVPRSVPTLWSSAPPACPVTAPAQARALASEKRIVADGKRERHPFYASDGVEAVTLYETAAACFRAAGDAASADELGAAAEQLRADVNDDFRVRRLRLERALSTKNDDVAAHEVVMLRALMLDKQGPYSDWINALARKLEVDKDSP